MKRRPGGKEKSGLNETVNRSALGFLGFGNGDQLVESLGQLLVKVAPLLQDLSILGDAIGF